MQSKVFVGGLSFGTTDEVLRDGFARFGEITDARVIMDRDTHRSRGFGFVEFASADSARQAIAEMDGAEFDGRTIRVNEATERSRTGGGGRRPGGFGRGSAGGPGGGRGRSAGRRGGGGRW